MNKDVLIGQLRQGNTADEILSILETICQEFVEDSQTTSEEIEF